MLIAKAFVFVFGLVVGSFLNVCIYRIPRKQSVVEPRSRCPNCQRPIPAWENLPVLSYVLLRARCPGCGARISWVYPVVEAVTALSFYLLFLKYGVVPSLIVNMIFFGLLIILIFVDLFERLLPNVLTLGGAIVGWLVSPLQSPEFFYGSRVHQSFFDWTHYLGSGLGILVGGGFLWLVAILYLKVRKIEGMGFGDIKMMAMVGAFLGWQYAWLTILLGSFLGVFVGMAFIAIYRKGKAYELPFGSFLGAGAMVSTLIGPKLFSWYFSLF